MPDMPDMLELLDEIDAPLSVAKGQLKEFRALWLRAMDGEIKDDYFDLIEDLVYALEKAVTRAQRPIRREQKLLESQEVGVDVTA